MATCLECGDRIVGRSDKKFCSDSCRNSFNNKIHRDRTNLMRNINNQLRRNYRILRELNRSGKTNIQREKLTTAGFDFNYFTQLITYKNGNQYRFIYSEGYRMLDDQWVLLVRKQS